MKKILNVLGLIAMIAPLSFSIGCDTGGGGAGIEGANEEQVEREEGVGTVDGVGETQ